MKASMMLFSLNPGDSLFVYTDGIPEATNSTDEQYEESRTLNPPPP
ncbi:MAG: SpoIIE family protein phosphatase [Lachnospiraceae bacterium]|nr:SpoIIE family protein phosphatase [Lachnospiraceae bacterium]